MLRFCLLVLVGAVTTSMLPVLPGAGWCAAAALAGLLAACHRRTRAVAALVAGAVLLWHAALLQLADRLPGSLQGNTFTFPAQIIEFPQIKSESLRLVVAPDETPDLPARVRLSWYEAPLTPRVGERWQFSARLRPPRGSLNPGGFDYAGWLFRERIGATGYVLAGERLDAAPRAGLARLRRDLVDHVEALLPADDASAALLAISVGARQHVTARAWDRYAVTGTSHLMAISGLHIGLAAAGAGALAWWLAVCSGSRVNARGVAVLGGVLAAAAYSAVSGFAVPAQRAVVMLALAAGAWHLRRTVSPPLVLAVAAVMVLAAEPLALLTPGFKLSFGAVAILLWLARRRGQGGAAAVAPVRWLRELGVLQAALLLGLLPLTAFLFQRVAWLAPLTNLLVLPVFSFITVPAALAGLLLCTAWPAAGDLLLWLAYYSLRAVQSVLVVVAALPGAERPLASPVSIAARVLFVLPALWVLLPPGFPGRGLAWLAFLGVVTWRPPLPPANCVDVHTLDVGQGLATVVRTRAYTLLFDTGPAFRGGGNSAEYVILPFLSSQGIRRIDTLIVSHADQDHAGGAAVLAAALPVGRVLAGEPLPGLLQPQQSCRAGQSWHRDGIVFRMLHPADPPADGNDGSCVLEIAAGNERALLTGDIGKRVERQLAAAGRLRRTALVGVPHHGSRTSSGDALVDAVQAEAAVVSAGYRNRWGFPQDDVVERWRASGADVLTTANSGALHHRLCRSGGLQLVSRHRYAARRFWHDAGD